MHFSKICFDDEGCSHICFGEKEDFNIHQLFHIRYSFHKEVYSHKVIKGMFFYLFMLMLLFLRKSFNSSSFISCGINDWRHTKGSGRLF